MIEERLRNSQNTNVGIKSKLLTVGGFSFHVVRTDVSEVSNNVPITNVINVAVPRSS